MRGTRNRKVVVLHRRPRRNVPKRMPILGYAAGGTSTTFRSCIKEYTIDVGKDSVTDVYQFSINDAFTKVDSALKMIPAIYTNFQIQRVTFRVLSTVGTSTGGISSGWVIDDSMGIPTESALSLKDAISRGGSTCGKIWQDIALEWVPTEPEDLNYRTSDVKELYFAYSAQLAQKATEKIMIGLLVADVQMVARTLNSAQSVVSMLRSSCSSSESRAVTREITVEVPDLPTA